jgi:hypothetical protein
MRPVIRTALIGVLVSAGLQAQSSAPPLTWRVSEAPGQLREAISCGDLIVVSLQDALLRELTTALAQGGPALAIQSCHVDVIGVSQRFARQRGVAAGRTSDRLRNPANAPAGWAAPLVKASAGKRARYVDGFVADLDDAIGLLRPIAHQAMCNACHGPVDRIDPAILPALGARYPADRAVGFREGDIRGWFRVEVPKYLR